VSTHLEHLARVYSPRHYALYEALDRSLDPRGPDMLAATAGTYLRPGDAILDIGCRDAAHLIKLVQASQAHGVGLDPLDWHVERALAAVRAAQLEERIQIVKGVIEQIEQPDERFDLVWCRDVLELVEGVERGLAEAARVLKAHGRMLVYTVFATDLLEPKEAAMINGPLGNVAKNFDEAAMERAFRGAGLIVERKDVIGTEWREYEEERTRPASRDLLRLARLRRRRHQIVEQYGQELFDLAQASLSWLPYLLLGKLQPTMYILKRP